MAKRYYGYSSSEVLSHLKSEYDRSKNYVEAKRQLFRARLKDYTNITSDKKNIYVRLVYSVMQMLMAMHYEDKMSVRFSGIQLGSSEIADNWQNLAEFDSKEMNLDEIMYQIEWDRLFFGKSFLLFDHWDYVKQHPVYRRVSPMAVMPDMYPDPVYGPKYYQFELEVDSAYLTKENGFYNTNNLNNSINQEIEDNKEAYEQVRELTHQAPGGGISYQIPVHYCYTHLGGEKYFIVTALTHGIILKMEKIEPIYKEEKKDQKNIKFPVIEFSLSPLEGDYFGVCVPDLIADKQRALQLLLNLEKTKAVRQALGGKYLVDTTKVNIRQLIQQKEGPNYIPHKGSIDVGSTVVPIPQDAIPGDILSVVGQLQNQAQLDIGLDEQSLGVAGSSNVTATENQRIQKNANLRQILNTRIKMWGIKDFWWDWKKRYHENFNRKSEKNILINTRVQSKPYTIKRKDIITGYDVLIDIVSKSEEESQKEKEKVGFLAMLPYIIQDPNNSEISKKFALRKALRLQGSTPEEARLMISPSYEEMQAMLDVELLNNNEEPAPIVNISEDHYTFMVVYHRAHPTDARARAIAARQEAYIRSGQALVQQNNNAMQQGGGAINQMANAAIQEGGKEVKASSFSDIQ